MTIQQRTQGFIFRSQDVLEADRMFSLFTKDFGRIEVLGKAIRKITSKLRGGMKLFSFSQIEFVQGEKRKTLTDALSLQIFNHISDAPEKLVLADRISELIDHFIKGEERDEEVFNLLTDVFTKLNNAQCSNINIELLYDYFFWNFISVLGYKPEVQVCAVCRQSLRPHLLHFSHAEGGILCNSCAKTRKENMPVAADTVKVLRLMLKKDWAMISKLKMDTTTKKSLEDILKSYHQYLLLNLLPGSIKYD